MKEFIKLLTYTQNGKQSADKETKESIESRLKGETGNNFLPLEKASNCLSFPGNNNWNLFDSLTETKAGKMFQS